MEGQQSEGGKVGRVEGDGWEEGERELRVERSVTDTQDRTKLRKEKNTRLVYEK